MGIISWVVFGFVVGLIARAIMPGTQKMGFILTTLLGVVGSLLGGMVASLFTHARMTDFNTVGFIGSVIGALLVLGIFGLVNRRRLAHI